MSNLKSSNVLIAIPCLLLGGTEYQTLYLVKALSQSNYKVTLLCYFEYSRIMVEYMKEAGAEVILMSEDGVRPVGIFPTLKALFLGIRKVMRTYSPDIVHVQYLAPGALPILLFKLLGAKKVIATAHVPGHIYKRKWIPQLVSKYLTNMFMTVSLSSEESFFDEKPELYDKGLVKSGRKHCTLYNCVEITQKLKEQKNDKDKNFTLGVVSRLSHEKGIDRLIEAMPLILEKLPDTKLLIIGDGAKQKSLEQQAEKLNIKYAITWAGLQAKESLKNYYTQMDLVIIPSRFEGFGLTAIEAMNYGVPVVASNVDGLKEIIQDDNFGILTDTSNPSSLANAIVHLLEDVNKRKSIKINSYSRVKAVFSYNSYKTKIVNLYDELS